MFERNEIEKIVAIIDANFEREASAISEREIEKFLQNAEMVALPNDVKLIVLAGRLLNLEVHLDWSSFRRIYDVALQQIDDPLGIEAVWFNLAVGEWLQPPTTYSSADRLLAAKFAEELLSASWAIDPQNSSTAHGFGLINYYHPDRSAEHLRTALNWFTTAVSLSEVELDALDSIVGIGDCNFDLGNWPEALCAYERINTPLLKNLEEEQQTAIKERIADCKKFLE
ncbi:MAG: hypothetical protein WCT03_09095 [Candidatus Obscuribacterales bacterium]|jgi:hypothetical protein